MDQPAVGASAESKPAMNRPMAVPSTNPSIASRTAMGTSTGEYVAARIGADATSADSGERCDPAERHLEAKGTSSEQQQRHVNDEDEETH